MSVVMAVLMLATLTPAGAVPKGEIDPPIPQIPKPKPQPQPDDGGPKPRPIPGVPRFKIEAVNFTAVDESGPDFFGSDEPMFIFSTDVNGDVVTKRSREYGNVDSGDTRSLFNQCLIRDCTKGFTSDTTLSVQLFEMDGGSRESIRAWVENLVLAGELGSMAATGEKVDVPDWVIDALVDLFGDDLMGSTTLRYDVSEMAKQMRVGQSKIETHRLGGMNGDLPFLIAGGPDYDLRLRVTRMADAPRVLVATPPIIRFRAA